MLPSLLFPSVLHSPICPWRQPRGLVFCVFLHNRRSDLQLLRTAHRLLLGRSFLTDPFWAYICHLRLVHLRAANTIGQRELGAAGAVQMLPSTLSSLQTYEFHLAGKESSNFPNVAQSSQEGDLYKCVLVSSDVEAKFKRFRNACPAL